LNFGISIDAFELC